MSTVHETEIYVRYAESDAIGHVNNTSYFLYFEEGRTKFFDVVNPNRDPSVVFLLASIKCDYLSEAFPKQTLKLSSAIKRIGTTSFTVNQIITNPETGMVVASAETTLVYYNYATKKSIPITGDFRKKLEDRLFVFEVTK